MGFVIFSQIAEVLSQVEYYHQQYSFKSPDQNILRAL